MHEHVIIESMVNNVKNLKLVLAASLGAVLFTSCGGGLNNGSNGSGTPPSSSQPPQSTQSINTVIIPLYSYPTGQYADQWQTLYNFQTDKNVYVIVNPSNGPGTSSDPNFTNAIATLESKNFKVLGYVYTNYGNLSLSTVENQINEWFTLYPNINGIFIDEVSSSLNNYSYYADLYNYIKSLNKNNIVVLNPGTNIDPSFFNIADKIIVEEDTYQNFASYTYSYSQEPSANVCIIISGVPTKKDFYTSQTHGFNINSTCQYITNYSGSTEYFYVSNYLPLYQ